MLITSLLIQSHDKTNQKDTSSKKKDDDAGSDDSDDGFRLKPDSSDDSSSDFPRYGEDDSSSEYENMPDTLDFKVTPCTFSADSQINEEINSKVSLWQGDITRLEIDGFDPYLTSYH